MMRKYPKTTGYYVYVHVTPDKMCYFGMSKQQPCKRWQPSSYKDISLQPGIEEFGWDNIEHMVIQDGLTKHQAEVIEDWFIKNDTKDGLCINKQRSGGIMRDNPNKYKRDLYKNNTEYREHQLEWHRKYSQRPEVKEHKREYNRNRYQKDVEYREHILERHREYEKTEKRKEYKREYYREYMREYRLKKKQQTIKEQ